MSVQSFRMRSTQGSSSNIMECEISLKNPRTNFPITSTTDTYRPMILQAGDSGVNYSTFSAWKVSELTSLPYMFHLTAWIILRIESLPISCKEAQTRWADFVIEDDHRQDTTVIWGGEAVSNADVPPLLNPTAVQGPVAFQRQRHVLEALLVSWWTL